MNPSCQSFSFFQADFYAIQIKVIGMRKKSPDISKVHTVEIGVKTSDCDLTGQLAIANLLSLFLMETCLLCGQRRFRAIPFEILVGQNRNKKYGGGLPKEYVGDGAHQIIWIWCRL